MTSDDARSHAVDRAYHDHATDVYRVAFGIVRQPDEAVDLTQDTFARAWERWEQYDSQRPLRAWLHGIVVHLALDQLRRRRVRRIAAPSLVNGLGPTTHGAAPDPASDIVQRRVVEEALETLRPDARAALVLRHYYGYGYAEIGALLGMAPGTVGSTLSRAHATLRERLGGEADTRPDLSRTQRRRATTEPASERPEVLP